MKNLTYTPVYWNGIVNLRGDIVKQLFKLYI